MYEEEFSITSDLRDDRVDGEDRKKFPRHSDVPVTSYLDVRNLIIDTSDVIEGEKLPSIEEMLVELLPYN